MKSHILKLNVVYFTWIPSKMKNQSMTLKYIQHSSINLQHRINFLVVAPAVLDIYILLCHYVNCN